jgi:hypothetical protein
MKTSREAPPHLARLLEGVDWSQCSGRDLHRLAEGAAQAAMRSRVCRDHLRAAQSNLEKSLNFPATTLANHLTMPQSHPASFREAKAAQRQKRTSKQRPKADLLTSRAITYQNHRLSHRQEIDDA